MEITELVKEIQVYNDGEHDYVRIEDIYNIAILGVYSFKEVINKVCLDKKEFNSYFDKEALKLGNGKILKETLIENFNKIGIVITENNTDNDNK